MNGSVPITDDKLCAQNIDKNPNIRLTGLSIATMIFDMDKTFSL
jgi:hypothetical protein